MSYLIGYLEATTQGLFEALQQSHAWRMLYNSKRTLGDYAVSLERFYSAQLLRDIALHQSGFWPVTQLPIARQLPALEADLYRLGLPMSIDDSAAFFSTQLLELMCGNYHGFLAAFYVDEQLRLMHDTLASGVPADWPREYLSGAAIRYRWPQARDFIAHKIHGDLDALEVSWLAQEHLVRLVESASDNRCHMSQRPKLKSEQVLR